ncbi:hypothetical protein SPFL3102_03553 [Sporomusaceae bacterium FL31]|nr:hypothetical protein SPFL3101_00452 [Sporomusaceae bacterium FL31]GCE35702.1 hypothetical protein SPFL3102_03553 [Sporomusaceae bacterium]
MSMNEYLRLANRYRENMKVLEEKYAQKDIQKYPEDYLQCLDHKISYHTYKGLYWEARSRRPEGRPEKSLKIRDSHYRKREEVLRDLKRYKQQYSY